jgi:CheY-like chemotaxis protein
LALAVPLVFSIDLPRLSDSQIETFKLNQRLETQEHSAARLTGLHILLAEDNIINQQIAVEVLEAEGAKVSVANNGQEAVEYLIQHLRPDHSSYVDLILMDLQMPVMDGITATQKIRAELKLNDVPIIAMTANAMASDRDACLRAGMNAHLGKPFDAPHLIQIICQYTGQCDVANHPTAAQVAAAPAVSSEEHAVHQEEAICLQDAIRRMGGNQIMYLKLLPRFQQQLDELPNRLQTLVVADDMVTFSRELHSLKGSSAMMGASNFSNEIAAIEKLLKHDPQHPDTQQRVAKVFELIAQCSADFAALAATFAAERD